MKKGPAKEECQRSKGPAMEECQRSDIRMGVSGEQLGEWDNGFYITGLVAGVDVSFLLDSGSTSSLISTKLYQSIMNDGNISLKSCAKRMLMVMSCLSWEVWILKFSSREINIHSLCWYVIYPKMRFLVKISY
jgi:hypothetical protein